MINRTKIQDSAYSILDEDPEKIREYIDTEAKKDPKKKEKERETRNKKSSITDVNLQENIDNQEDNPYNKVVIHTEKDNLVHNYFHYFDMYWDAGDPLSNAILKLPKTNTENTKYWITYTGEVTIYLGNEINQEMGKTEDKTNTYIGLEGLKPIFKGEIGQIKEYGKELEIHIDSIGKRFKQKIPDEFRQSFINNQNVRDAFQAICEFLGVKYICPPGSSPTEDDDTEEETPTGDGTENNVNDKTNQEQQLASQASQATNTSSDTSQTNNTTANNDTNMQNTDTSNTDDQNNLSQNDSDSSTQEEDIQNGYSDISFDANGAIVHASNVIETSPNMEKVLLSMDEMPLEKYLTDTTFVATDVKKFLNGEMFDTVHSNVMNYNAITIEPKSAPTSDMSTIGSTGTTGTNPDGTENTENGTSNGYSAGPNFGYTSGRAREKNGWIGGQYYIDNKIYLSDEYINSLTPSQAWAKYTEGLRTGVYREGTLNRLRARGYRQKIL